MEADQLLRAHMAKDPANANKFKCVIGFVIVVIAFCVSGQIMHLWLPKRTLLPLLLTAAESTTLFSRASRRQTFTLAWCAEQLELLS